jgi:predicted RNA-binding protein with PUA-like domain
MRYWLMKSEPSDVSVDDVAARPNQTVNWYGVRNFQARNFMKDEMKPGDGVLFYHSSCPEPGVVGIAEVASAPYPDPTQFDPKNDYYDPKSRPEAPRWIHVDVRLLRKTRLLGLPEMRAIPELAEMRVLKKGNRLSITPVSAAEWKKITSLLS